MHMVHKIPHGTILLYLIPCETYLCHEVLHDAVESKDMATGCDLGA